MAQRRRCTAQFKPQMVLDLLTGRRRTAPRCREHDLKAQIVTRWRAVLLDRAEILLSAEPEREGHLERSAELARVVGRLTMARDIAQKASQLWGARAPRSGS